jgi:hypothetical protein
VLTSDVRGRATTAQWTCTRGIPGCGSRATVVRQALRPKYAHSVSSGFPRWWRLGLAITEVVLAAGLIVAAVTEGGWYWWAGAIAAATLALINLSVHLRTEPERRRQPGP